MSVTDCRHRLRAEEESMHEVVHAVAEACSVPVCVDVFCSGDKACTTENIRPEIFVLSFNEVITIAAGKLIKGC